MFSTSEISYDLTLRCVDESRAYILYYSNPLIFLNSINAPFWITMNCSLHSVRMLVWLCGVYWKLLCSECTILISVMLLQDHKMPQTFRIMMYQYTQYRNDRDEATSEQICICLTTTRIPRGLSAILHTSVYYVYFSCFHKAFIFYSCFWFDWCYLSDVDIWLSDPSSGTPSNTRLQLMA